MMIYPIVDIPVGKLNNPLSRDVMFFAPDGRYHCTMEVFVLEQTGENSLWVVVVCFDGDHLKSDVKIRSLSTSNVYWLATLGTCYTGTSVHLANGTRLSPCTVVYPVNAFNW